MFRVVAKKWKGGKVTASCEVTVPEKDTRTHKVFKAMAEVCREMDLAEPLWLDKNIRDFQARARCSFDADSFVEEIGFDRLDFAVAEEDERWEA